MPNKINLATENVVVGFRPALFLRTPGHRVVAQASIRSILLRWICCVCKNFAHGEFLVNKEEPAFSSKLKCLAELLEQLAAEEDRKIVLFSEWTAKT